MKIKLSYTTPSLEFLEDSLIPSKHGLSEKY